MGKLKAPFAWKQEFRELEGLLDAHGDAPTELGFGRLSLDGKRWAAGGAIVAVGNAHVGTASPKLTDVYCAAIADVVLDPHGTHFTPAPEGEAIVELPSDSLVFALLRERGAQVGEEDRFPRSDHGQPAGVLAVVGRGTVLGGAGLGMGAGQSVTIVFRNDELAIERADADSITVPYAEVQGLEIGGPGAVTSGGGFIGGGFGLQGATEGMIVSSILNALTTRTTVNTILALTTAGGEIFIHTDQCEPEQLRYRLSPVFVALRRHASKSPPSAGTGEAKVERLTQLAALVEKGLLSEAEFADLKRELLAGPPSGS